MEVRKSFEENHIKKQLGVRVVWLRWRVCRFNTQNPAMTIVGPLKTPVQLTNNSIKFIIIMIVIMSIFLFRLS